MPYKICWVVVNTYGKVMAINLSLTAVATEQEAIDWITANTQYPNSGYREYEGEYDGYAIYEIPDPEEQPKNCLYLRTRKTIWPPQLKQKKLPL